MSKTVDTNTKKYEEFQINVGRYVDKVRGLDFPTYEAFVGKRQRRINVKFRKDAKNIPTETCVIKVAIDEMSLDTRNKYPSLWIHNVTEILPLETLNNNKAVENFFGGNDKDLPF